MCDDIKLDKKLGTHSWRKRVNLGIFGVSIVDNYNVSTKSLAYEETSHLYLCDLTEGMINNYLNQRPPIPLSKRTGRSASPVLVSKCVAAHLFQTCKKKTTYW